MNEIWDIEVSAGEYNRSEHRAFHYGESLKQFASALESQGFDISLIGHSMGNIVCGSALQKGLTVQNYVLMEAAVPAGCYDSSSSAAGGVNGYLRFWNAETQAPTPDYHQAPNGELTQGYRGFLESVGANVAGEMVNFHNSDDYALATGYKLGGVLEANWEANQESYKPDGVGPGPNRITSNSSWFYGYTSQYPISHRAWLYNSSYIFDSFPWDPVYESSPWRMNLRAVTDSYEIKTRVARPRSRAIGAGEGTTANPLAGGPVTANVNMRTNYGFDTRESDHSGQFNRRIQELGALYLRLFESFQ